nr:NADH dehydrogenase subunit 2 [Ilyograpsus nodulosus]
MMFPSSYIVFLFTLILGSLISISSTSWFGGWVGLELNMVSFIPLISIKMNSYFSEAALKYFLIQALGSTLFIYSSTLMILFIQLSSTFIMFALLLKLGAAPFHFWFPQVMEGLNWPQVFVLSTIQKLAPMMLISYLTSNMILIKIIFFSAILSALIGAWTGFNLTFLRKIMAFSSINHMSWMLMASSLGDNFWLLYFCFYTLISLSVIMTFFKLQAYTISMLIQSNKKATSMAFMLFLNMISLGGLPPMTGFIPKWMVIQMMINLNLYLALFIFLLSALITLYFYLRISIPLILMLNPMSSFNILSTNNSLKSPLLLILTNFNILGLFIPFYFMLI